MEKTHYIYSLRDPRDNQIYYIGKTSNPPEIRRQQHVRETLKGIETNKPLSGKHQWIKTLLDKEMEPTISVIKQLYIWEDIFHVEKQIIKEYLEIYPLLNIMHNDGIPQYMEDEGNNNDYNWDELWKMGEDVVIMTKIEAGFDRKSIIMDHHEAFQPHMEKWLNGYDNMNSEREEIFINWLIRKFSSKFRKRSVLNPPVFYRKALLPT